MRSASLIKILFTRQGLIKINKIIILQAVCESNKPSDCFHSDHQNELFKSGRDRSY